MWYSGYKSAARRDVGVVGRMWNWLLWGGALLLLWAAVWRWRAIRREELERRVLEKKYGDLPMFDDFFRRLREERRRQRGRA